RLFLLSKYGKDSKEYLELDSTLKSIQEFSHITLAYYDSLQTVFNHYQNNQSQLIAFKKTLLIHYKQQILNRLNPSKSRFKKFRTDDWFPKNCFFNDISMYRKSQSNLNEILNNEFNGNLPKLITHYRATNGNRMMFW